MSWLKRIIRPSIQLLATCLLLLVTLEVCYRNYWFDFYQTDFSYLNNFAPSSGKNILVFGDSFSAQPISYVNKLRQSDSTINTYNLSLPGSHPTIASYYAPTYIEKLNPDVVICQLYLGNDLSDASYPTNWKELSTARNLYWTFANYFHVLRFLNYRFANLSATINTDFDEEGLSTNKNPQLFDPSTYSPRMKMMLKANPNFLNESYFVNSEKSKDALQQIIISLKDIQSTLPTTCDFKILIIPHAISVDQTYSKQYELLGATTFNNSETYPIISHLQNEFGSKIILDAHATLISLENEGVQSYYSNDDHLNEKGHIGLLHLVRNQLP
jgi:hypothetical protein